MTDKKLQDVRNALLSLANDNFGSEEAVNDVIHQAIADLDEYIAVLQMGGSND